MLIGIIVYGNVKIFHILKYQIVNWKMGLSYLIVITTYENSIKN